MDCTLMDVGAWRGLPQRRTMLCSQSELEEQLESSGDINGEEIYLLMVKYNLLAFSPYSALPRDLPQEVYGEDEEVVLVTLPLPVHVWAAKQLLKKHGR